MKHKRMFAAVKNQANELEVLLYDQIGEDFWTGTGVTPKAIADQIKAAGQVSRIVLRINSPGGDVFDGSAIYNQFAQSGIPVDVFIDGLAASAASYVAMVGRTVTMGEGSMMMIHNPWGVTIGDSTDMRKMADTLDKVRESMLGAYQKKYTGSQKDLIALLDAETWLTAKDAVELGFASEVAAHKKSDPSAVAACFDLAKFKHTPEHLKKAQTMTACPCPCNPCEMGNCDECNNTNCTFDCPDCPMQAAGNAPGPDNPAGNKDAEIRAEQEAAASLAEEQGKKNRAAKEDRLTRVAHLNLTKPPEAKAVQV